MDVAFGFLIVNPPPVTVSTKSTSALEVANADRIDEQLHAVRLEHLIPSALPVFLDHQTIWNPEQPPPCTNTRRPLPACFLQQTAR